MPEEEPVITENSEETQTQETQTEKSWLETLSPELRENPNVTKFKSPEDMAKSWIEAQRIIGKEKIPVPGEDAKPEDWDMVYDRLGRPKDADSYQLPEVEMPKGLEFEEENLKEFRAQAHKLGLTQKQVEGLFSYHADTQKQSYQQMVEQSEKDSQEAEKALRKEWGTAYGEKLQMANKALKMAAGDDFDKLNAKIGNDPVAIKALANLASKMSEDTLGPGNNKNFSRTPEAAKAEIAKLQKQLMGMDSLDPERKFVREKLDVAYREAYPEAASSTAG